ncbi:MAG: hypothetical protein IPM59_10730 [Chloracidobacterium sp.]|nr:hypothetical protein [Chloracidobacterium sp.]
MREALFILAILGVLLALTAVKYRKQIVGMIGFARALKEGPRRPVTDAERSAGRLVECARCGIRIPESKAVRLSSGTFRCDRECSPLTGC